MSTLTIPITSEAEWLATRAQDVTSTEVAALYGLSPFVTEFELWHRKRDNAVEDREPDQRVKWGTRLQDAIAAGVAEERGWRMQRLDIYMRDPQDRLGCSFDYEAIDSDLGTGGAEIKNVDRAVFFDEWLDRPTGIEAPQHIELQVQVQMELRDAPWWAICALVGGNDLKVTIRERDRVVGRLVREKVRAFWRSIAANEPPRPDYARDAEFVCRLHGRADAGLTIDADDELAALLARYVELGELTKQRDSIKAQVFERTTASRIRTAFGTFSCGEVAASEGRRGFRQLRFTPSKRPMP